MSRGPGRWQRTLLAALADHDQVVVPRLVDAVSGGQGTHPQHVAARRAAYALVRAGRAQQTTRVLPAVGSGLTARALVLTPPSPTVAGDDTPSRSSSASGA